MFKAYVNFLDHVLTIEKLRDRVWHAWETTRCYMRWYLRISHPYLLPIHAGNPTRLSEEEALVEIAVEGAQIYMHTWSDSVTASGRRQLDY